MRDILLSFEFFSSISLLVIILWGYWMLEKQFQEHISVMYAILDAVGGKLPALQAERIEFYLIDRGQEKRWTTMLVVKADAAPKKFRLKFKDKFGNAAPVDGKPSASLLNAEAGVASLTLGDAKEGEVGVYDGEISFLGKAGMTQISVLADADMDPAVQKELVGQSEEIQVLSADASVVEIEFLPEEAPVVAKK